MLSKAEEVYIAELIKGKSQRQAYLIAYPKSSKWKEKTVDERACRLFNADKIQARYKELLETTRKQIEKKCLVDVEYVITSIKEVAERCLQRKPVMVREGKRMVQKTDDDGEGVWEFDSAGANRSLELLGKHLKLFTDKLEVETSEDLADLLKARREKVLGRGK